MTPSLTRPLCAALTGLALALTTACNNGDLAPSTPVSPEPSLGKTSNLPPYAPWSRIVTGSTGPGALYAVYVPTAWNGDAVTIAHGFRDAASPIDLRDQDGLYETREALGALGYAVAYSSYAQNGFAIKDGALRTHQLRGVLTSVLGRAPATHLLVGYSLGGGVVVSLAEQYPTQYQGALTVCGLVGGSLVQTQYLGHVRALFDSYYTDVVPGNALGVPIGTMVTDSQIVAAVAFSPLGVLAMASTKETPLPYDTTGNVLDPSSISARTLVVSLWTAVSFHARGINNIADLTHGKAPFGNATTTYTLGTPVGLPPVMLEQLIAATNDSVARYVMPPSAVNYLTQNFTPSGKLRIPLLTVHNRWDPAVPMLHEIALNKIVQAAGTSGMLLQRTVPTYGHCAVPAPVLVGAFTDLVGWVHTGVKPAM